MKQILSLALAMLPCLAWAQYPSNGNQKITLGEQTTADGLVYRGIRGDTLSKIIPFSDTSAYIILDTVEKTLWLYKAGQTPKWQQVGGSSGGGGGSGTVTSIIGGTGLTGGTITTSGTLAADTNFLVTVFDTASMLTNYYRSGRALGTPLSGVLTNATGLPLTTGVTGTLGGGNGGTGITTFGAANRIPYASSTTALTTSGNLTYTPSGGLIQLGTGEQYFTVGSTNGIYSGIQFKSNSGNNTLFHNGTGTGVFGIGGGGQGSGSNKIAAFYGGISIGTNYMNTAVPLNSMIVEGNVGLGTITSPSTILHIGKVGYDVVIIEASSFESYLTLKNNTGTGLGLKFQDTNQAKNIWYKEGKFTMGGGGQVPSTLTAWGNMSVGDDDIAAPTNGLRVKGNARFASTTSVTDLRTDADGQLFNGSDFNLKNSIDTINFGLSDVLKLKPVSFNWNNEARNISEFKTMGFIAQDVMNVIPNAASTMGDGDMQVDYNAIVATLTKAIQEQQAIIKALEQRIINLENK